MLIKIDDTDFFIYEFN